MTKNAKIALSILAALAVVLLAGLAYADWQSPKGGPRPQSTMESHFLLHEMYYDCSQAIEGEWREAKVGQMRESGHYFYPANQEEFEKFCRAGAIIEYKAVLDILAREDVRRDIEKYDTTKAWVRALGHVYIHDKDYLKRILPTYSDVKIDCIIVVHSPEGNRFFIENGEKHESHADHRYMEIPATEFLASLNAASDEDVTNFWLGLH
jgi:hypothetical protein